MGEKLCNEGSSEWGQGENGVEMKTKRKEEKREEVGVKKSLCGRNFFSSFLLVMIRTAYRYFF